MYGILKSSDNTGSDDELACLFAAPIAINSRKIAFASDTLSLKRITSASEAQRWEIETSVAASNNGIAFFVNNITNDVNNTIFVRMPQPVHKIGTAIGAARGFGVETGDELLVSSGIRLAHTAGTDGNNNILLGTYSDGAEEYPSVNPSLNDNSAFAFAKGTGIVTNSVNALDSTVVITLDFYSQIFLGSFIRFQYDTKVYMVKNYIGLNGNDVTVGIYPKLRQAITSGDTVELGNNVVARMKYETDSIVGMRYSDGVMSDPGTIRLVEDL